MAPAVLVVALAAAATGVGPPADAATTVRIVTDSLTGLALSGFDPVAYFTDRAPRLGDGKHELTYRGAVWRFQNEGNRGAFAHDPDVYLPRFGGYDPIALTRGVAVAGHPLIWLIFGDRLFLFSKVENRARFAADLERSLAAAERHWRDVEAALSP